MIKTSDTIQNCSEIINSGIHLVQIVIQMIVHPKRMNTIPKRLVIISTLANLSVLKSLSFKIYSDGYPLGHILLPYSPLIQICCSFESKTFLDQDSRTIGEL
ncbi:unnamed protein product [Paramecium sonneborni]|uniref:Uncharacterized protein n=1 Tax=Paramecium sonneborni TaxID=65129 RepID=A0A8S1QH94_9CILI|nr:unnamed protein product [Paramecium sonneborni]